MKLFATIILLSSTLSQAANLNILKITSEAPYLRCEINSNNVKIERQSGGVRFTREFSFQSNNLSDLVQSALKETSFQTNSSFTIESAQGQNVKIKSLDSSGTETEQNLIRFMNKICSL